MKLLLQRLRGSEEATLSALFLDGQFQCFGLEDQKQLYKVAGETRIPSGVYQVSLRAEGGMTKRYAEKFPGLHEGMLWLRDVNDFNWVYIHIGNTDDHTEGCILVGQTASSDSMTIGKSTSAYEALYRKVRDAAAEGTLQIEIIDEVIC